MAHATLIVTCSGGTYFDRDYYVDVHLPLALACWQRHGLESASAFFSRVTPTPQMFPWASSSQITVLKFARLRFVIKTLGECLPSVEPSFGAVPSYDGIVPILALDRA